MDVVIVLCVLCYFNNDKSALKCPRYTSRAHHKELAVYLYLPVIMVNFSLTFLWAGACKRNDQVSKQQQASYRSIPAFQSMLRMGPFGSGLTLPSGKLHRGGPVLNFQTCFYSMYLSQTRTHTQFLECFVPLSPICVKFNKCNILWSAHTHIWT